MMVTAARFCIPTLAGMALPPHVAAAASEEELSRLGLSGGQFQLLPAFLHALRELKRGGRSFSVCFRTFGTDLVKIAPEFNACASGPSSRIRTGFQSWTSAITRLGTNATARCRARFLRFFFRSAVSLFRLVVRRARLTSDLHSFRVILF